MPNTIAARPARTLGADLVTLQRTGLSTDYLFDVYGVGESIARDTAERRAYVGAADLAGSVLRMMGLRSRSGTNFRLASAILVEMTTAPICDYCAGAGRLQLVAAHVELVCPGCLGSGLRRESTTWRVQATDCHYTDFRDRLQSVYQVTLTLLAGLRRTASDSRAETRRARMPNAALVGCDAATVRLFPG
jgi:hypothetical protein